MKFLKIIKDTFLVLVITLLLLEVSLQLIGYILHSTNSGNYTDRNSVKAPSSKQLYRIMVLGESTSYGMYLTDRTKNAFPYLIKSRLKKNRDVELLNLSHPGQISDSIVNSFNKNFYKYRPDLVICQFGVNDSVSALNPFLQLRAFGYLIHPIARKIKLIKFVTLLYLNFIQKKYFTQGKDGHFIFYDESLKNTPANLEYLNATRFNYLQIIKTLKEHETKFLILSYFDAPEEIYDLFKELKFKTGAHYLNIRLYEEKSESDLYAKDLWHPNLKGHKVIAEKLVDFITQESNNFFRQPKNSEN